jgi:hypothetical protein
MTENSSTNMIVAYIDLLAFSTYVRDNTQSANLLINNYNEILRIMREDQIPYDQGLYDETPELKKLAQRNLCDSFQYYIPFSDSIFIASHNVDSLLMQLSNFQLKCFRLTTNTQESYYDEKKQNSPFESKLVQIERNPATGKCTTIYEKYEDYPTLFRGGISYGEAFAISVDRILDFKAEKTETLMGKSVVEAVILESKHKGPTYYMSKSVIDNIKDTSIKKQFTRLAIPENDIYELLWPAACFINKDDINEIRPIYHWAVRYYNHFSQEEDEIRNQYVSFLQLVVDSAVVFWTAQNKQDLAIDAVKKWLDEDKIAYKHEHDNDRIIIE